MRSAAERTWESILRIHAAVLPRLERTVLRSTGLPLAWYDVLLELKRAGGQLTMTELGDRVVLSRTRVSRLVDELAAAALVEKEPNPGDGRSYLAGITPLGKRRFLEAARIYLPAIDDQLAQLDEAKLEQVAIRLEELWAAIDELTDRSRPASASADD